MRKQTLERRRNVHRSHTKSKFLQCFGIELTDQEYAKMYKAIRDQYKGIKVEGIKVKWIGSQSLSRGVYQIAFKGVNAFVIYNKTTQRIATILKDVKLSK